MKTIDVNTNNEFNVSFASVTSKLGTPEGVFEGHWPVMAEVGDVIRISSLGKDYSYQALSVARENHWATVRVILIDTKLWPAEKILEMLLEREEACTRFSKCISALMQNHAELRDEINSRMGWKS